MAAGSSASVASCWCWVSCFSHFVKPSGFRSGDDTCMKTSYNPIKASVIIQRVNLRTGACTCCDGNCGIQLLGEDVTSPVPEPDQRGSLISSCKTKKLRFLWWAVLQFLCMFMDLFTSEAKCESYVILTSAEIHLIHFLLFWVASWFSRL